MKRLWNPGDPPLRGMPPLAEGFSTADREVDCDVVIVGAGPGGGAVARVAALAGARVVILEEGPPQSRFGKHQQPAMRYHMQEGGAMVTTGTTTFPIASGRGVGGGTLINSAIAWRAPDEVLQKWTDLVGDERFSPSAMRPRYDELWAMLGITPTRVEVAGRNNDLIVQGVRALGLEGGYLDRYTPLCVGCGICYYGCPSGGKSSVNLNLFAEAAANGARVVADTKVEAVLVEGDRAVGLVGRMFHPDTGEAGGRVTVRAPKVVLAAGAVGTPRLLHHCGLAERLGPAVGKGLHVHPGNAVLGFWDEPVHLWRGATQGAWFRPPDDHGCLPHTFSAPPEACIALLHAVGEDPKRAIARLPYLGGLLVMVSDTGEGTVGAWPDGRAKMSYTFADSDVARIKSGMHWVAKVLLAAGATELFLPVRGTRRHRDADALFDDVSPKQLADFTMYASHPMSTCRMGRDPATSVIRPDGRTHALEGLYIADASMFPTSLGVNPSVTIMAMATILGEGIVGA